jgi:hypothetical protein
MAERHGKQSEERGKKGGGGGWPRRWLSMSLNSG